MYFVNLSSSQSFWFTSHSVESVAGSCWDVSRPRVKGWMMTPRYVVKVWSQGMMPTWNQGLWGFVGPGDYVLGSQGSGLFRGPCDIMWLCSSIRLNLSKCCSRKSSSWSNLTQALVPSQSPVICELSPSIRSSLPWCVVLVRIFCWWREQGGWREESPNAPVLQLLFAQATRDVDDFAIHVQDFLCGVLRGVCEAGEVSTGTIETIETMETMTMWTITLEERSVVTGTVKSMKSSRECRHIRHLHFWQKISQWRDILCMDLSPEVSEGSDGRQPRHGVSETDKSFHPWHKKMPAERKI